MGGVDFVIVIPVWIVPLLQVIAAKLTVGQQQLVFQGKPKFIPRMQVAANQAAGFHIFEVLDCEHVLLSFELFGQVAR